MLDKEFVPYQEALEMKALGFDEPCFGWFTLEGGGAKPMFILEKCYNQDVGLCLGPTFSQAFRWFREKHNICHQITRAGRDGEFNAFVNDYIYGNNGKYSPSIFTYEEAELACLRKLIEIVKNK